MYSSYQICDRLQISESTLKSRVEIIEKITNSQLECTDYNGTKYYQAIATGLIIQLDDWLDAGGEVLEFKPSQVDREGVIKFMKGDNETLPQPKEISYSSSQITKIPQAEIVNAVVPAIANEINEFPLVEQDEVSKFFAKHRRARAYPVINEFIEQGNDFSTDELIDLMIFKGKPKIKVGGYRQYGSFTFTYLGKNLWKPSKDGDLRLPR